MKRSLLNGFAAGFVILVCLTAVSAQSTAPSDVFGKAPPEVDEALRRRVSGFYQAYVDGKFRAADQFVAEDSKDTFFAAQKQKYRGFEVVRINFEEDFTKAQVVTAVDTDFVMPFGGARIPVKAPITTLWKIENGLWCWYVPEDAGRNTPFGKMSPGPDNPQSQSMPLPTGKEVEALTGQVKVSRTSMSLSTAAPNSDEITIFNNMPGSIGLEMDYPNMIDFSAKLEKANLGSGESTKLIASWTSSAGGDRGTIPIRLTIMPINMTYNIEVKFNANPVAGPSTGVVPRN